MIAQRCSNNLPEALEWLEDFMVARTFPNAFDFRSMPLRWQDAQTQIAIAWDVHQRANSRCAFMTK